MKTLVAFLLLAAGRVGAQQDSALTLNDAISIARENSRSLKVSAARAAVAEGRAGAAGTVLLPALKFEGSYRRLSDVPPFVVTVPFLNRSFEVSPTLVDNTLLRVSLQQPLFTGFKLRSNARMAEALASAAELDLTSDREDLDLAVTTAYWTLYQTRQAKSLADENVSRLRSYLRDSENLLNAGVATRNDVLKIQVQLNNARLTQIDAANDVTVAGMILNNVMGRPLDTDIVPASSPGGGSLPDTTERASSERALQERHDLRAMEARVEAARAGLTAARGGWWPQLFLSANYYYANPNSRYQPLIAQFKDSWDVGVTLQFDLWNWGQTGYESDQAQATLVQNETLLDQMKETIRLDVRRQTLAVRRAREKVDVATVGVEQAEENLRTLSDKFKGGVATSSDLLDADVALLQARTNLTGARIELELAAARLSRAVGPAPKN